MNIDAKQHLQVAFFTYLNRLLYNIQVLDFSTAKMYTSQRVYFDRIALVQVLVYSCYSNNINGENIWINPMETTDALKQN